MSIGDRMKLTGISHKGIDVELEIVGRLPDGRYNKSAIMNVASFKAAMDKYQQTTRRKHPKADRSLNLIYLRAVDRDAANRIKQRIETSPRFTHPRLSCETVANEIAKARKE
jgi:hypothetical protein